MNMFVSEIEKTQNAKNKTISNTEINSFLTCEQQHYYAYNLNIEPRESKIYFYRGEIGHAALEAYYFDMQQGSKIETCRKAALQVIRIETQRIIDEEVLESDKINILAELTDTLNQYFEYYPKEPFKVISVEDEFRAHLTDDIDFMLRLDLLVEFTEGDFRGDLALYDHKFLFNFKSPTELMMDGQIPKYLKTLKECGYPVSKGYLNQIRYRKDAKERFARKRIPVNLTALNKIWADQAAAALRINEQPTPIRLMNPYTCKGCDYLELCSSELNGSNTDAMIKSSFKRRDRPFKDVD